MLFFERSDSFSGTGQGEKAVLVHVEFSNGRGSEDLDEFELLVTSALVQPVAIITGSRLSPHSKYFIGTGKLEDLKKCIEHEEADVVLFNHTLSASQERNLETYLGCCVLDRTGLILDIFAQRARTFEGKMQVELAQLKHLSTRLIRGWTHLERQKGGIGMRGPGETQLESDRRLVRVRIESITRRLEKVRAQRDQGRRSRQKAELPTASFVGYTNAGKSTLFNRLCGADVYVADKLFATLDPTLRRVELPQLGSVVLADTVGFIRHLPHKLVEAFQATLEETQLSNLLIHVVDVSSTDTDVTIETVNEVLRDVGAQDIPVLYVYNKVDLLEDKGAGLDRDAEGNPIRVWLSAKTGEGVDYFWQAVSELLARDQLIGSVKLTPAMGQLRAKLYADADVSEERVEDNGDLYLSLRIEKKTFKQILKSVGLMDTDILADFGSSSLQDDDELSTMPTR